VLHLHCAVPKACGPLQTSCQAAQQDKNFSRSLWAFAFICAFDTVYSIHLYKMRRKIQHDVSLPKLSAGLSFPGQCNASRLCLGGLLEEPSTLFHPFLSFPFAGAWKQKHLAATLKCHWI